MNDQGWCDKLTKASRFESESDVRDYAEASAALKGATEPNVLASMLEALNDIETGEVQYELIEACESFPDEVYVPVFLDRVESLAKTAPFWSELMLTSLLNAEGTRQRVSDYLQQQSEVRLEYFRRRLEELAEQGSLDIDVVAYWRNRTKGA